MSRTNFDISQALGSAISGINDQLDRAYWFSLYEIDDNVEEEYLPSLQQLLRIDGEEFEVALGECGLPQRQGNKGMYNSWEVFLSSYNIRGYELTSSKINKKPVRWVLRLGCSKNGACKSAAEQIKKMWTVPRLATQTMNNLRRDLASCIKSHINATIDDRNIKSSNQNTTTPAENVDTDTTTTIPTATAPSVNVDTTNETTNDTSNRVKDFVNGFMSLTEDQVQFVMHEGFKDLQRRRTTPI
jgi:hypothetical protein